MSRELNIRLYRKGRSTDGAEGYWQVGYDFTLSDFAAFCRASAIRSFLSLLAYAR
jgi:hypothetical protein